VGGYVYSSTKDRMQASANMKMTWGLSGLAITLMWMLWACVYMHQMNPLIKPILLTEH